MADKYEKAIQRAVDAGDIEAVELLKRQRAIDRARAAGDTEAVELLAGAPLPLPPSNLPAAAGAGGWRGLLGTLDIVPRGIVGGINTVQDLFGVGPELGPVAYQPFSTLGATLGLGQFQPRTPAEQKAAFAGEIIGASALPAVGTVSRAAAPTRALLTEAAAAGGAAGGGMVGQDVAGPAGQAVGTLAGGFAPLAAPWAARTVVSPLGQRQMQSTLGAAERQGIPLSAGQAAGGSFTERASATLPGGISRAGRFADEQAERFGQRVDELARGLSPREASPESAGRAITEGIENWAERFRTTGQQKFEQLNRYIPEDSPVFITRTPKAFKEIEAPEEFADILDAPIIRRLSERLEVRGIEFGVLRRVRSAIGAALTDPSIIPDAPRGQLKKIYGAITDDLESAIRSKGPQAQAAFEDANRFWREGMKQVDDFLDPIMRRKYPEQVFQAAMQGTNLGASRIQALKESLDPEQWNTVVATVLRRMGKARPSEQKLEGVTETASGFSPETFLTNLAKLDDRARESLFTGSDFDGLQRNVDDLMTVASGIRGQRQVAYNPSGTALGMLNALSVGAPLGALVAGSPGLATQFAAGVGANYGLQRALQSPSVVNYLANPVQFSPATVPQLTRGAMVTPGLLEIIGQEEE